MAGLLADEFSSDKGEASAGSNGDWMLLAVTTIAEVDIRKSIPEGVDYVISINGWELPDESIERIFMS